MEIASFVLAIVTGAAAVIALIISIIQITTSNKQALFERRLKAFLTIKWMKQLCDENTSLKETFLKDKDEPMLSIDLFFVYMTNSSDLEVLQTVVGHVLESEYQRKYLLKIEELRSLCEEVRLIFPESIGYQLADFVYYYEEMLVAMYEYQVAIKSIRKESEKKPFPVNNSVEVRQRKSMIRFIEGTFLLSERLFKNGILEKAKSSIKLVR